MQNGNSNGNNKSFEKALQDQIAFRASTEMSFSKLAWELIKRKGCNRKVFAERTLLSEKTYDRIKTDTLSNPNPAIEIVMSVCIGLKLGFLYGIPLLEAAGYRLTNSPQHCAYRQLLASCSRKDIYECNAILVESGFKPLSKSGY